MQQTAPSVGSARNTDNTKCRINIIGYLSWAEPPAMCGAAFVIQELSMQSPDIESALSASHELLGERLSTGTSVLEIPGRGKAYTPPVKPDGVAFPESRR